MKTYPEMNNIIVGLLRFSDNLTSLYAAQRIVELEEELQKAQAEAAVMREALEHIKNELFKLQGQMIPSKQASCTLIDLRTFVSEALSSTTAGQEMLDRIKTLEQQNQVLFKEIASDCVFRGVKSDMTKCLKTGKDCCLENCYRVK